MPRRKIFYVIFLLIISLVTYGLCFKNNEIIENEYHKVKKVIQEKENAIDQYRKLFNNNDIIATIEIKNLFDEMVVQSSDNEYYLDHSIKKEKYKYGSVFMDYRNTISDKKIIIYGHSSTKAEPPFKKLTKYIDKTFYKSNSIISLETIEGISQYKIFSIMINFKGNYRHTALGFNESQWLDHINWMNNNSIYDTGVKADINDEILTLQTCYFNPKNSYLIINAKKI